MMEAAHHQDFYRHVQGWVRIIKQDALKLELMAWLRICTYNLVPHPTRDECTKEKLNDQQ